MANNVMETQVKKISLALGALVDGAYLWAGADKGIASELQGKDQGDTVYYRVSGLGDMGGITRISDGSGDFTGSGKTYYPVSADGEAFPSGGSYPSPATPGYATLSSIKQVVIPVSVKDINVMYEVKAFERQCTSIGEALARAKVGQKLIKNVIKAQIREDIKSISNIFVGSAADQSSSGSANQFIAFQLCGAHMKSFLDSELYGFMDWNVWGRVTATGQQAVPCALAKPEFGKELVGSWTLINQLRIIPDLPPITGVTATGITGTIATTVAGDEKMEITFTSTGTLPTSGWFLVDLYGSVSGGSAVQIENVDGNDIPNGRYAQFLINAALIDSDGKYKIDEPAWIKMLKAYKGYTLTVQASTDNLVNGKTYGMTIVRGENAQVWGTVDTINCEGAHYSKSSVEGVTIHENKQAEVRALKTYDRFDLVYAAKLVEPRLASIVLIQLD